MQAIKTCKILYIEDDPASRMLVERTLRHAGYRVIVAENGLDGIDLARREAPDLILTDINLPDISGREVTTMLRSDDRFDHTPIVALTAQALHEQREMTMAAGITGYLTKPLDIEALPGQVQHYLDGARDEIDLDRLTAAQTRYTQEVVGRLENRVRELEALNKELRRLDKMKDTFIELTAHELRTPLTLIFGYSKLLEDNPVLRQAIHDDESARILVEGLSDAIKRMQGIVNEIVTISRIMTNQIDLSTGALHLGAVVEKAIKAYQQALTDRRLTVHFKKSDWPDHMRADPDLMALALANLLSNAIKYTPDGGDIWLKASYNDHEVRFSIKDTGIGIDPDDQTNIFQRFHTTNDVRLHSTSKTAFRGGGIGLGLAICQGIIEAHNGRIWVESEKRDPDTLPGSEFFVVMPLMTESTRKQRL